MFYQIFFIDDHNEGTQIMQMVDKVSIRKIFVILTCIYR